MADQNSTFNPLDEERKANRPDIPELKAQEGINNSSTSSLRSSYSSRNDNSNSSNSLNSNQTNNENGDARSQLSDAESSPWKNSAVAASATGVAGLTAKGVKNVFFGSKRRKQATIGGGVGATIVGGAITLFGIFAGPAQLIQLSHVLQSNFSNSQNVTSNRANKLFRYATASDPYESRVGLLGRQFLGPAIQNLKDIGVEFDLNPASGLNKVTIDTKLLGEKYADLGELSPDDRAQWLDNALPSAAGRFEYQGDGVYTVDNSSSSLSLDSLLANDSLSLLGDGKIITGINGRVLSDYLNVSSLFHPLSRAAEAGLKKATTLAQKKKAVEGEEQTADGGVEDNPAAVSAANDAKEDDDSFNDPIEKGLLVSATACFMRNVSSSINTLNKYRIALPAVVEAMRFISIGEQIESGQDISASQVNDTESSLGNVFQGEALQATEGLSGSSYRGTNDLPDDYKQAFTGSGLASTIKSWANGALGGSVPASAICSTPGQYAQILVGLGISASDIFDGGASSAIVFTVNQSESFIQSALVMRLLHQVILNKTTDGKLAKTAFSGPLGGNLLAYGARYAADLGGAAQGLIPESNSDAKTTAYVEEQQNQKQFDSESVFARVFNINDGRTILGHLADSFTPSVSQGLASVVDDFSNIGSVLFSNLGSIFTHKTSAVTAYNWGFPEVGIPNSMLNNPQLANPYSNADDVADILNSSSSECVNSDGSTNTSCPIITKANTCFGDDIEKDPSDPTGKVWDVVKDQVVDMTSDAYQNADCGNTSDMTWQRVVMFVVDTRTMQGIACFEGDDQSCQEIGEEAGTATTTSPPTTTTTCGSSSTPTSSSYFTVSGSTVCDPNGNTYIPYGVSVNDALVGPDWQNQQFQEATAAQIQAGAQYWHANTIRIQVSEAEIMGSSTSASSYNTGAMQQLGDQVNEIESENMIPVISDNTEQSDNTETAPTARTEAFWKATMSYLSSQSSTKYTNVIFDIFNEPSNVTWGIWKSGGTGTQGFASVGMQDVVNSIRNDSSPLNNNLIWAEGPSSGDTLASLDQYQLSGNNIEYSYHHVDFSSQSTDWKSDAGLELTIKVPIVDGEWAQYASAGPECQPEAPQYIDSYFNTLKTNNIGLVFWSLEPGVGTTTPDPAPVSSKIDSDWVGSDGKFPTTASDFSQPNSFQSNYSCTGGINGQPLIDQGAGQKVMQYFQQNDTSSSTSQTNIPD